MSETETSAFVPVLTVMVDYGNAPFLWLVERPDQGGVGGMLCESGGWEDYYPMSEALWRKFAIWAISFARMPLHMIHSDNDHWDWPAFHARGLQLARELKAEVGDAYRVVYEKPAEDPNSSLDERREVLADGSLQALPYPASRQPLLFCERIISGGQTGADRAALDFAARPYSHYLHGGWAPQGREAEDGCIPLKYQLTELPAGGYRQRTRRNVEDSDGTLIVNLGELDGGTLATKIFAEKAGKPHYVAQVDDGATDEMAASVLAWLRAHHIKTLNVAGPRESKRPGIYPQTTALLQAVDKALFEDVP